MQGGKNWELVEAGRKGFFFPLPAVRMVEEKAPGCVSASTRRGRGRSSWIMPPMSATTSFTNIFLQLVLMADL